MASAKQGLKAVKTAIDNKSFQFAVSQAEKLTHDEKTNFMACVKGLMKKANVGRVG